MKNILSKILKGKKTEEEAAFVPYEGYERDSCIVSIAMEAVLCNCENHIKHFNSTMDNIEERYQVKVYNYIELIKYFIDATERLADVRDQKYLNGTMTLFSYSSNRMYISTYNDGVLANIAEYNFDRAGLYNIVAHYMLSTTVRYSSYSEFQG